MSKLILSNQTMPVALNLIAAIAGAYGQYMYKLGGSKIDVVPLYKNFPLIAGIILFCLVMVLFVVAFRLGGRISIVYPAYATTFIWATLIAIFIAKEPWSVTQLIGIITIVAGFIMVATGAPE